MAGYRPGSMRLGFGASQALVTCPTGATHLEKGVPCQDACMVSQHYYRGVPYSIMVVADGHGSEKYSRSDVGAHFAAKAAGDAATELVVTLASMREEYPDDWLKMLSHEVTHRLGRVVVQRWRARVEEHADSHPQAGVEPGSDAWLGRYGSTVALAILYDEQWLITASLGDSAIYFASRQGDRYNIRELVATSHEGLGLGTDSLLSPRANYLWRYDVISTIHEPPAMILLTTDGLIDSLDSPLESISDLCEQTMRHGVGWLEKVLPQQLARWSAGGVGDDMGCIAWFPTLPEISQDIDPRVAMTHEAASLVCSSQPKPMNPSIAAGAYKMVSQEIRPSPAPNAAEEGRLAQPSKIAGPKTQENQGNLNGKQDD